jgi:hypothetical protein
MKRVLSLAVTTSVLLLLSACRTGNVGMNNRNNNALNGTNQGPTVGMGSNNYGTGNGTTNIGRTSGTNMNNYSKSSYKDGGFTNFGNGHDNVNERAVVNIRNGRIVSIDLATVSQQEASNYGTNAGTGYGTRTGYGTNDLIGNGTNAGYTTGTGNATGTGYGNGATTNYGANPGFGTDTGYGLGSGYDTGYGTNSEYRVGTGLNNNIGNGTNTGINTGLGTGTNTITGTRTAAPLNATNDTLNNTKTYLINAMIQAQSDNVTLDNIDKNMTTAVENWKLAVSRALYQANR